MSNVLFPPRVPDKLERIVKPVYGDTWRTTLRAKVGRNGERLMDVLLSLAEGKPQIINMPDGRVSENIPTPDVQLRAGIWLGEMLFGKAVTQTEQLKAENEASDLEAVRSLSDEELESKARAVLERGLRKLAKRNPIVEIVAESASEE